jgi:hypothetical protein
MRKIIMNTRRITPHPISILLIACAVIPSLLSACQPMGVSNSPTLVQPTETLPPVQTPAATQQPTDKPVAQNTQTPAQATQPPAGISGDITLDLSGIAQGQTVETVAATPPGAGEPYWEAAPQYRRMTLQGYPVADHLMKPQIFIYPAEDLAGFNETAGKMVTDLQALLQSQQPVERMPFLPLYNAAQVMHAQTQYMDFKNGKGVRYLTQFDQAPLPLNNYELIYTFQGLTNDGKYYIAAVLPVTHPDLPNTQQVSAQQADEMQDFSAYLAKTVAWLDQQPGSSFNPDLTKLDAMIQSIEIN